VWRKHAGVPSLGREYDRFGILVEPTEPWKLLVFAAAFVVLWFASVAGSWLRRC
jgi:hypothetical protein